MGILYDTSKKKWKVDYEKTDYRTDFKTDRPESEKYRVKVSDKCDQRNAYGNCVGKDRYENRTRELKSNILANKEGAKLNKENKELNQKNTYLNDGYKKTLEVASITKGSDYVNRRDKIRSIQNVDKKVLNQIESSFKDFYRTEKLEKWDSKLGAKPPYGSFDPKYYKGISKTADAKWKAAVAQDDLDITERYQNEEGFLLYHYTNVGKPAGARGNKAEVTTAANTYKEKAPTDKDIQDVRNLQLKIGDDRTARLLKVPEIKKQWELAKKGDAYWKKLAKEKFLDVTKPDQFAALFRLSNREEDKAIAFKLNANAGYGVSELEDALSTAVGAKALVDTQKFGALTQDALKRTIEEIKKARAREQELELYKGFAGFDEIASINDTLAESILGDSGVGGILSFTSGGKSEDSLKKALGNVTGVGNNATYNWQNWFENTLKKEYDKDLELGYTTDEATKKIKIQADFAKNFIDKYLVPRFDTSRSMDEFVEYMDVRQEEQNPFQTQSMVNAVKQTADLRAKNYLDQLKKTDTRYFNTDFYFNPTGDAARKEAYAEQKSTVAKDWEAAKKGDEYWAKQAYRFGLDVKDKEDFAKLHFQVKGQGKGYDPADDILNASKVSKKIYEDILPALKEEALKQGTVFGQFVKPEEFADEMLKGVDPKDNEQVKQILDKLGLQDFKGTVDELKKYIADAMRTGSAKQIRENIKYLNEKRRKPTQENLGITYIQRDEDEATDKVKAETELYKVFTKAGYKGTESDFYEKFFPDLDKSEQQLLTKSGRNKTLGAFDLDLKDPYAALGTLDSFFEADETPEKTTSSSSKKEKSYFSLDLDDDEDVSYKSQRGQQILGEFTSKFKGLQGF